jgi:hypothetical protein
MEPIILRNSKEAMKNLYAWHTGGKSYDQATKDFLRKTIVVGAQAERWYNARVHPDFADSKRVNTMAREFKDKHNIVAPVFESNIKSSQYYRNLREKLLFGTDDQIGSAYWNAHNYVVRYMLESKPTLRRSQAIKDAHKAIESSLRHMNPVNFSHETKGRKFGVSQRKYFLKWIKENMGVRDYEMALRQEKVYKKNLTRAQRIKRMSKYRNKFSEYGWA